MGIQPKPLDYMLYVNMAIRDCLITNWIWSSYLISIGEHELLTDLVLLDIWSFDIILSMD